jgi:hypothetical protein
MIFPPGTASASPEADNCLLKDMPKEEIFRCCFCWTRQPTGADRDNAK